MAFADKELEKVRNQNQKTLDKLSDQIENVEAKVNRLGNTPFTPGNRSTPEDAEHKAAFKNFFKCGVDNGLRNLEIRNAISDGSDPNGGYALPVELDRNLSEIVRNSVAMRRLANVISAGVGYTKLVSSNSFGFGWVGELDSRPATDNSTLHKLIPYFGEIYAAPVASQNSLDDLFFDVENWITTELGKCFVSAEGAGYLTGTGSNMPRGLLTYPTSAEVDGVRAFGTIQHIASGNSTSFPAVSATYSPLDNLLDLIGSVKAVYRANAKFLLNKSTLTYLRKIKTAIEGEYVVTLPTAAQPGTILGYGYEEDENMPNIGADSLPIAFGDFKAAYTIVDVVGTRMLRDPFTSKGSVIFYSTKRSGSFLENSEAVKFIKIASA